MHTDLCSKFKLFKRNTNLKHILKGRFYSKIDVFHCNIKAIINYSVQYLAINYSPYLDKKMTLLNSLAHNALYFARCEMTKLKVL